MRRTSLLLLCIVGVLPSAARAAEPAPELRVFYTGHSFHMFVPAHMTKFTRAADLKEYQLAGQQGIGGSRVIQHWDLEDDKNKAKKALESGKVDVFTMAPHVKIPDEGIDRFVELGLKHNPKMRFLIQESWVPHDSLEKRIANNSERDKTDLEKLRGEQKKWREQMEAQAKTLNKKVEREAVAIIPVGLAVLALREKVAADKVPGVKKQSELFTDPIGHGTATIQLLAAYCNYVSITGKSPVGLKINDAKVSDEVNKLLQEIAWDTVTSYPMSGVKAKK